MDDAHLNSLRPPTAADIVERVFSMRLEQRGASGSPNQGEVQVNADALSPSGVGIRVQKARKPGSGRPMWLVLGDDCLPIGPN
jgi:hypothetical protein